MRRNTRRFGGIVLGLVVALWLSSPAWAVNSGSQSGTAKGSSAGSASHDSHAATKGTGKDTVASAFALPKGTELNATQQKAYDRLKAKKEPELRAAVKLVANTTDKAKKIKAARDAKDVRSEIGTEIQKILAMPVVAAEKEALGDLRRAQIWRHGYSNIPASATSGGSQGSRCPCGR